jgi:hypothetical protein
VKDNVLPKNIPALDAIVGWEETYFTSLRFSPGASSGARSATIYYHPGDSDGHHIKGDYVFVLLQDGGDYSSTSTTSSRSSPNVHSQEAGSLPPVPVPVGL